MNSSFAVYYLRQSLRRESRCTALSLNIQEVSFTAHFYVAADEPTEAGAAAGAFCASQGLECMEYICLPQEISLSQIGEHEEEHRGAYELALQNGFAMVAAVVLTW